MDFPHPVTGESLETQADFQRALGDVAEQLAPLYRVRRLIEEARAERFEAVLPAARARTPTQDKIARCPRCGAVEHPFTYTKVFTSSEEMNAFLKFLAESGKDE